MLIRVCVSKNIPKMYIWGSAFENILLAKLNDVNCIKLAKKGPVEPSTCSSLFFNCWKEIKTIPSKSKNNQLFSMSSKNPKHPCCDSFTDVL